MSSKSRGSSELINVVPYTYDDATVVDQPVRPVRGDLWFTAPPPNPFEILAKKPLKTPEGKAIVTRKAQRVVPLKTPEGKAVVTRKAQRVVTLKTPDFAKRPLEGKLQQFRTSKPSLRTVIPSPRVTKLRGKR